MRKKTRNDKAAVAGTGTKLSDLCFDIIRYDWGQGKEDILTCNSHLSTGLVYEST